jgi:hypothetical protein
MAFCVQDLNIFLFLIPMYTVYVLQLADMRGSVDRYTPIAFFSSLGQARAYEESMRVAPWTDGPSPDDFGSTHKYHKVYRKNSPLEWYNPPDNYGAGIYEYSYPSNAQELAI